MSTLRTHPVAAAFPPISDILFDALIADMQSNGQRLPIALYDGMISDGRARHRACAELGIKPWIVPLRREEPVEFYILANYDRAGAPSSPARKAVVAALLQAGGDTARAEARTRRTEWIRRARAEFEDWVREKREPCAVCKRHIEFVHAHHSFPLSLQFECGIDEPIHDYQWLCPIHHKHVHILLSGYLLGSRDLSFLDGIPEELTEEWLAIEDSAAKGIDLCCEALGHVPGEKAPRRYDPPYSLLLLRNYGAWQTGEWKRTAGLPPSCS
jgi:hypothetical protein